MLAPDRPRERYSAWGPETFGDVDLLALVLGTGSAGVSARAIALALLERFDGVAGIAQSPVAALAQVVGVGPARAVRVHAACSLAQRSRTPTSRRIVRDAQAAFAVLGPALRELGVEELHALYLNRRGAILANRRLTRGNDGFTIVDPRQVLRPAVACGASALILAHNHPSGDPAPSAGDLEVTRTVAEASRVVGLTLLDHLVIGNPGWTSLAERGELATWARGGPPITG